MANERLEHGSSSFHAVMRGYQLAMRAGPAFHAQRSSEGISPFEHLHLWVRRREKQTGGEEDEMVGCTLLLSEIKCSLPRAALSFNFTYSL